MLDYGKQFDAPSPGWRADPESGVWLRDTIHRMTRRCRDWDYRGTGAYLITIVLNDRSRPLFGKVAGDTAGLVRFEPSELGRHIENHFLEIGSFSPEIEVVGVQMMSEHLHGVLRVRSRLLKPLGEHLRGFKIGATKIARSMGILCAGGQGNGEAMRGKGLFADGFVDTILWGDEAEKKGLAYMYDNPRRFWVKRNNPSLFKVSRNLELSLSIDGQERTARFSAIGNQALLKAPHILQVQVSRRDFAYRRHPDGSLVKAPPYAVSTGAFEERSSLLLAAAGHGTVLISPCVSEGEREIARRASEIGARTITLRNKGFSPLYKPGGQSFDICAAGNLLVLAPGAWPYLPGKKAITRIDACILNRIAQLIAGEGAAKINYRGIGPGDIDRLVLEAVGPSGVS